MENENKIEEGSGNNPYHVASDAELNSLAKQNTKNQLVRRISRLQYWVFIMTEVMLLPLVLFAFAMLIQYAFNQGGGHIDLELFKELFKDTFNEVYRNITWQVYVFINIFFLVGTGFYYVGARLHDMRLSALWQIPVYVILAAVSCLRHVYNSYYALPTHRIGESLNDYLLLIAILWFVILGIIPSDPEPNRYGPVPRKGKTTPFSDNEQ